MSVPIIWPQKTIHRLEPTYILAALPKDNRTIWNSSDSIKQISTLISHVVNTHNANKLAMTEHASVFEPISFNHDRWKPLENKGFQIYGYRETVHHVRNTVDAFFITLGAEIEDLPRLPNRLVFFGRKTDHRVIDIFVIATAQAWEALSGFRDKKFPVIIARKLFNPSYVEITFRPIFGTTLSKNEKKIQEREEHDLGSRLRIVTKVVSTVKAIITEALDSSLKPLFESNRMAKLEGGVQLQHQLAPNSFPLLLDYYSTLLHQTAPAAPTQFLDEVHEAEAKLVSSLRKSLLKELWNAFKGDTLTLRFCPRQINDFFNGKIHKLVQNGKTLRQWKSPKTALELIDELNEIPDFQKTKSSDSFEEFAKLVKGVSYQFEINGQTKKSDLLSCFEGEVVATSEERHYFHLGGKWYFIEFDLLANLYTKFQSLLESALIRDRDEAYLTMTWKGKVTEAEREDVEGEYNLSYKDHPDTFVGDKACPNGIELGDLFRIGATGCLYIYQVKKGFDHNARNAANQLINAAKMLSELLHKPKARKDYCERFEAELKKENEQAYEALKAKQKNDPRWVLSNLLDRKHDQICFVYAFANETGARGTIESELLLFKTIAMEEIGNICKSVSSSPKAEDVFQALVNGQWITSRGHVTFQLLRCTFRNSATEIKQGREEFCRKFDLATMSELDKSTLHEHLAQLVGSEYKSAIPRFSFFDAWKKIRKLGFNLKFCHIPHEKSVQPRAISIPQMRKALSSVPTVQYIAGSIFRAAGEEAFELCPTWQDSESLLHALIGTLDGERYKYNPSSERLRSHFVNQIRNKLHEDSTFPQQFLLLISEALIPHTTLALLDVQRKLLTDQRTEKFVQTRIKLDAKWKSAKDNEITVFKAFYEGLKGALNEKEFLENLSGKKYKRTRKYPVSSFITDTRKIYEDEGKLDADYKKNRDAIKKFVKENKRVSTKTDKEMDILYVTLENYEENKQKLRNDINAGNTYTEKYLACLGQNEQYHFGILELQIASIVFDKPVRLFMAQGDSVIEVDLGRSKSSVDDKATILFCRHTQRGSLFWRCDRRDLKEDEKGSLEPPNVDGIESESSEDLEVMGSYFGESENTESFDLEDDEESEEWLGTAEPFTQATGQASQGKGVNPNDDNAYDQRHNVKYTYQATDIHAIALSPTIKAELQEFVFIQPLAHDHLPTRVGEIVAYANEGKCVLGIFNLSRTHWVTYCLVKNGENKLITLYKDSFGGREGELAELLNSKSAEFKTHPSSEQRGDGSSCGIMALENLRIMAKQINTNKENFIAQFETFPFCTLDRAAELRQKTFPACYTAGIVETEIMENEKAVQLNEFRELHQNEVDQIVAALTKVCSELLKVKAGITEGSSREIGVEIGSNNDGTDGYHYRIESSKDVTPEEIQELLKGSDYGWKEKIDYTLNERVVKVFKKIPGISLNGTPPP